MANFSLVQANKQSSIQESISTANSRLALKNREVLLHILEVFKFCVERGIALRGHNDDGLPSIDNEDYVNLGNFKAAVASHARYDQVLRDHLQSNKNSSYATYLSKYAQHDMTTVLLRHLQDAILEEARDQTGSFMFALSADEATDVSNTEQLAVVLRTVSSKGAINERLLEYIDLDSITGKAVAKALLDCLTKHNIDIEDCRAQTYDGAANMSGKNNGCQALIKERQPLAVYNHCSSHRLNLALNSTSKVAEFKIMMENIKRLGIFFTYSPKRTRVLEKILSEAEPPVSQKKVCMENSMNIPMLF